MASLFETLKKKFPDKFYPVHLLKSNLVDLTRSLQEQMVKQNINPLLIIGLNDNNFLNELNKELSNVYQKASLCSILSQNGPVGKPSKNCVPILLEKDDPLVNDWLFIVVDEHFTVTLSARSVVQENMIAATEEEEYLVVCFFDIEITAEAVRQTSKNLGNRYDPALNGRFRELLSIKLKNINPEKRIIHQQNFSEKTMQLLDNQNKQIRETYFWLSNLRKIQSSILHELDSNYLMQQFCRALIETLRPSYGGIELYDVRKKSIELQISWGDYAIKADQNLPEVRLLPEEAQNLLKLGQVVVFDDIATDKRLNFPIKLAEKGVKCGIALLFNQKKINLSGILLLFFSTKINFDKEKINWYISVSDTLVTALENAKMHMKLNQLAVTDALTGLYNHRYFQKRLQQECQRVDRYKGTLVLIILDIDYFKHYNETHGHPQGDVVLKTISRLLIDTLRFVDLVARYGGEEFIVILPESGINEGLIVAEKLRSAMEKHVFPHEKMQPDGDLTISLGVAEYVYDTGSPEEVINKADQALYRAKRNGRNRVYC